MFFNRKLKHAMKGIGKKQDKLTCESNPSKKNKYKIWQIN